jgi:UDP-N-acetylglucosamine acyltransferase
MIADGNPAEVRGINQVGLERRGFPPESTRALREAYRLLYRSNLNVKQACEKIAADHAGPEAIALLLEFIEASQRGIIR